MHKRSSQHIPKRSEVRFKAAISLINLLKEFELAFNLSNQLGNREIKLLEQHFLNIIKPS